jgi:predicted anti-sigma-YlaC factor YlaD
MTRICSSPALLACLLGATWVSAGCSLKTMAVKTVANTLAAGGDTFTRDDDPELVRDAAPFALKTYESLLETVPRHAGLLLATCSGFTQYAFAFVQADAETREATDYEAAAQLKERALKLYLRGRSYCIRALELKYRGVEQRLQVDPESALKKVTLADVPLLYWTGASWGAAIAIGLDKPALVADLPAVIALMKKALALQEDYGGGLIHEALIALEGVPAAMGGSPARARAHFARAVDLSGGGRPSAYVALATAVALPAQDRAEFDRLLQQALDIDPGKDPSHRLPALISQQRARLLRARIDQLFAPTNGDGPS